jgi:neurofibromin 1
MRALNLLLMDFPMIDINEKETKAVFGDNGYSTQATLFLKYFRFFLRAVESFKIYKNKDTGLEVARLLPVEKHIAILKSETISGLSNLLSANLDLGIKHSLAYDQDPMLRGIFVQVFTNVLKYGSSNTFLNGFNNRVSDSEKYTALVQSLIEEPYLLIQAAVESASFTEIDTMLKVYLDTLSRKGKTVEVVSYLLKLEIHNTGIVIIYLVDVSCIFRGTSFCTRLLSVFGKPRTFSFLENTVGVVLKKFLAENAKNCYEVDPIKVTDQSSLCSNFKNLEDLLTVLLDSFYSSSHLLGYSIRALCTNIFAFLEQKFPGNGRLAVGGFIFLRLVCPAIITPDLYGILNKQIEDKNLRRGLLLATKVIQNLANNVPFGHKEVHMARFNPFLKDQRARFDAFIDELSSVDLSDKLSSVDLSDDKISINKLTETQNFISDSMLHVFLSETFPKMKTMDPERLTTFFAPEDLGNHIPITKNLAQFMWKEQLDKIESIFETLGAPPNIELLTKNLGVRRASNNESLSQLPMISHAYAGVMQTLKKNRVMYVSTKPSLDKNPIFYYSAKMIQFNTIDHNAVIYNLISDLQTYFNSPIDIFIDLTSFGPLNEWPNEMMDSFEKLIPANAKASVNRVIILNANSYFKSVAKRYSKLFHTKSQMRIEFVYTLQEIYQFISEENLDLPEKTMALLKVSSTTFQNVNLFVQKRKELVTSISISANYLQITYTKKQDIMGFNVVISDFFPLLEVGDIGVVKDVDAKEKENMFIRLNDPDPVQYNFFSASRDTLLQVLNSSISLARLSNVKVQSADRAVKSEDLPGTLLNIAFTNLCSNYGSLRSAGYELLQAIKGRKDRGSDISSSYKLRVPVIPPNCEVFILKISQEMATNEKELSFEFLMECFNSFKKYSERLKYLSLLYMSPWLENIMQLDTKHSDKPTAICQKLVEILVTDPQTENTFLTQSLIWKLLGSQSNLVPIFIPALIEKAMKYPLDSPQVDTICSIILSMAPGNNILSELIQYIHGTFAEVLKESDITKLLESKNWKKICVEMRMLCHLSFDDVTDSTKHMADLCYFWIITAGIGFPVKRRTVASSILNIIYSLVDKNPSVHSLYITAKRLSTLGQSVFFGFDEIVAKDFDLKRFPLSCMEPENVPENKYEETQPEEIAYFCATLWDLILFGAPTPGN